MSEQHAYNPERDNPAPWDEPARLKFYGVDPGEYGNRERAERKAAHERLREGSE